MDHKAYDIYKKMCDNNRNAKRREIETLVRFLYYAWSGNISLEGRCGKKLNMDTINS